ncbi:MAG: PIN domain-containing protein, partial [Pseudomonadota bacterium]
MRFVVIYDACVLYPAPLRDFLIRLARTGLFSAKWTDDIHDEWIRNLSARRPEIAERLQRTRELMDRAVPDCLV